MWPFGMEGFSCFLSAIISNKPFIFLSNTDRSSLQQWCSSLLVPANDQSVFSKSTTEVLENDSNCQKNLVYNFTELCFKLAQINFPFNQAFNFQQSTENGEFRGAMAITRPCPCPTRDAPCGAQLSPANRRASGVQNFIKQVKSQHSYNKLSILSSNSFRHLKNYDTHEYWIHKPYFYSCWIYHKVNTHRILS